jgi:hypothetical protein
VQPSDSDEESKKDKKDKKVKAVDITVAPPHKI